ncbi:MAG: ATP-binding cassette domain-containing protein [Bacteroidetes bacterium]|nr:MAG: ATP-binding cassette domain-containing protein [Bacteroidota bacterium]REK05038.1 MAG: ATP-binding cassette domain-containing protein [Bacteroidota bacterium]REK36459.1 MAG: ATP-binding cassette domain-containing protein [Bacteroidota bacterium]REK51673.1 MAG: ATP-binding cassette domain-containing protein [Bacteroidota bacterium]
MSEESIVSIRNANIFQSNNLVLSNVNLEFQRGEFAYLIGKTGSGKSSLLKMLYGDVELSEGEGKVCGFSLNKLRVKDVPFLRRKLGIVFQDFQLLTDRSVNSNLFFVLKATGWKEKKKMSERVSQVLDKVGLSTKGFKMPHELSGGEQQRVVIARALLNDPDLILADEPTGNLDPETSEGIMRLLLEISQNQKAVLMATHNYSLIEKFPGRIIRCENGKLLDSKVMAESYQS